MKINEQVKKLKVEYPKYLILVKGGTFYTAYNDDAIILNYLLDYQINDNKTGFPGTSLEKVVEKLKENMINTYLIDTNIIKNEYDNNNYQEVLFKAKRNYFNQVNAQVLLEEIAFLIKNNPDNLNKIRSFVNEL